MATFRPQRITFDDDTFTEPCMHCFASVTYQMNEAIDHPHNVGSKCIVCPSCGKLMTVTFSNSCLC